eukprot:3055298-Prymnesium_polylepis.1
MGANLPEDGGQRALDVRRHRLVLDRVELGGTPCDRRAEATGRRGWRDRGGGGDRRAWRLGCARGMGSARCEGWRKCAARGRRRAVCGARCARVRCAAR